MFIVPGIAHNAKPDITQQPTYDEESYSDI